MNKEELKSKLDMVKDYIKFNTDAEKIADICNNNAHQQILKKYMMKDLMQQYGYLRWH
jgi:hypothetical protein